MKVQSAKGLFFDRVRVRSSVDRTTHRVLSRFGAYVRTRSRSSIRKRRRISAPSQPPSSHVGLLKRHIYFIYEPTRRSVVIGPTLLNSNSRAPELLEHGGTVTRRSKNLRYRPRPFMGPAFQKEQETLPNLWRNSVR